MTQQGREGGPRAGRGLPRDGCQREQREARKNVECGCTHLRVASEWPREESGRLEREERSSGYAMTPEACTSANKRNTRGPKARTEDE